MVVCTRLQQAENKALMHLVHVQQQRLATHVDIRVMRMLLLLNTLIWVALLMLERYFQPML